MDQKAPDKHAAKRGCSSSTEAPPAKRHQSSDAGRSPQPPPTSLPEGHQYRQVWEFVVLFRLVRGSDLCLPCQNTILDMTSNHIHGQPVQLAFSLPQGFNREYLDFLIDPEGPVQHSSSTGTPDIPPNSETTPLQPPMPASPLPGVTELTMEGPSDLRLCELVSQPGAQTQPPATPYGPASVGDTSRIFTSTRMFLHFPYFRAIISVIEAQGKIWITTRPEGFRTALHGRWMLALPEELAVKLWFACQGRYTLIDLTKERAFSSPAAFSPADTGNIGYGTEYMTMMRRYLLAVANATNSFSPGQPPEAPMCSCPGKGWFEDANVLPAAVSTAAVLAGNASSHHLPENNQADRTSDTSIQDSDFLSAEVIINQKISQQLYRFVTGRTQSELNFASGKPPNPPRSAYVDPKIISILEDSMSARAILELSKKDWMSVAFAHSVSERRLKDLSRTSGRQILYHVLVGLYEELGGAYQAAEPLPPHPPGELGGDGPRPVANPYPLTRPLECYPHWDPLNRPQPGSGVKPPEHTFLECRRYMDMQKTVDSWRDHVETLIGLPPMLTDQDNIPTSKTEATTSSSSSGSDLGNTNTPTPRQQRQQQQQRCEDKEQKRENRHRAKRFIKSVLSNQPWDYPLRWEGEGEKHLHPSVREMRAAVEFLAGGAMEWMHGPTGSTQS